MMSSGLGCWDEMGENRTTHNNSTYDRERAPHVSDIRNQESSIKYQSRC